MENHICFKCAESSTRTVATFKETCCQYFPAVMPQVRGFVTECDEFRLRDEEKE